MPQFPLKLLPKLQERKEERKSNRIHAASILTK